MVALEVSFLAVVVAGLLSFLSPCVLPLVPPYLVFITGTSLDDLTRSGNIATRPTMLAALAFVFGFSTVFVLLGATASAAGQLLRDHLPLLAQIAGIFIILMGLHFLGVFRFGLLNREARYHQDARPAGLIGAYVVGLAFAFGWTPCIGPVLATILAVAASEESSAKGALLLALYSAGLGIPFLLAAFGIDRFLGFLRRFSKHLGTVEKVMGALLVLAGIGFLTGFHQRFAYWLLETFPGFATLG
jgi:cytochrome c-type biogenesis protein